MTSPKKRDRNTKTRPQSAGELVESLTAGSLDGRTKHATAMVAAREFIDAAPTEAARALLVGGLAVWAVAHSACMAEISRARDILTGGELSPVLDTFQKVQGNILKLEAAIAAIDEKMAPKKSKGSAGIDIQILLNEEAQ